MPLGVLMLDTRFARFVGDIGNPQSYAEPTLFEVVRGATVDKVVPAKAPPLIDDFVAAGERLVARGAEAITTGCGFLVLNQAELASRLSVPVATSSLLMIPALLKLLPKGKRLGVLTFSARDLTPAHFVAAGAPADTPVEGVAQDGVFQKAIYEQPCDDSVAAREAEVVVAAQRLIVRHPDIGAILFECTNFPPHRAAVRAATGLPVYDVFTLIGIAQRGALNIGAQKLVYDPVELCGALEIDRMSRALNLRDTRVQHQFRQDVGEERRIDDIVLAGDPQRGDVEGAQRVGRPRHRLMQPSAQGHLVDAAQRIDLLVEEVCSRLLACEPLAARDVDVIRLVGAGRRCRLAFPRRQLIRVGEQGRGTRDRPGRAGEHQRAHAIRLRKRILERGPAAHGLRDDAHVARADMIDERREVARIVGGIRAARRRARRRKAAMREGHAGVAIAEVRHLLPPAQVIAAKAVREEEEGAAAVQLVVEAAAGPIEKTALH